MAGTTILHLSDLHFGWPFVRAVGDALVRAAAEVAPDAVVISGDLVQRGDFLHLFEEARAFIERLPRPLLTVPGNHDIPLWNPLRRALSPFRRYRRYIAGELDPILRLERATIAGINSARPWVIDLGHVALWQLERVRSAFASSPPGALRVVAMHHPLLPQKETGFFRHHVYGHRRAIRALAAAGAEVVLSGHNHFPLFSPLGEYAADGDGLVFAQAGTSTSMRLRPATGWPSQAFNVVRVDGSAEVTVEPWTYGAGRFAPAPALRFPRRGVVPPD